jgi:hypothetical protein
VQQGLPRRRNYRAAREDLLSGGKMFRVYFFFLRGGTLPPARRACERPMAIACLRLFTRWRERPLRNVPRLRSRIARFTLRCAVLPYLAMTGSSS